MDRRASPQQIDAFLQLFGDNTPAAIEAIEKRAQLLRSGSRGMYALPADKPVRTPAGPVIIATKDLTKTYKISRQRVAALNGVSLDIHQGEFVALMGPSGSGKSTLMQLMGGLEKPSSGSVSINGVDLRSMRDRKLSQFRGQTIGFVFQFFYLQPFLNLERNLEVPGMFARTPRQERRTRVRELAQAVGIIDRLKHFPKELSGGQIQRAAIARALLNNPKVILADEPTGNLDSKNSAGIIDLFEHIREKFGTTIVVATHDSMVAQRADRIITIKDGVLA